MSAVVMGVAFLAAIASTWCATVTWWYMRQYKLWTQHRREEAERREALKPWWVRSFDRSGDWVERVIFRVKG